MLPAVAAIQFSLFCVEPRRLPRSPLFPYTTLFRSVERGFLIGATRLMRRVWQLYVAHLLIFLVYTVAVHYLRSEEHTSELQSRGHLVCRLLLEKKNKRMKQREKRR